MSPRKLSFSRGVGVGRTSQPVGRGNARGVTVALGSLTVCSFWALREVLEFLGLRAHLSLCALIVAMTSRVNADEE